MKKYLHLLIFLLIPALIVSYDDDAEDEEDLLTIKQKHEFCIVGGGPAGLQMAHHMAKDNNDFILFERKRPGFSFESQPVHRSLISINKRFTSRANPVFNERHDWNSILSDNPDMVVGQYSKDYYPNASDYVKYLRDYGKMVEEQVEKNDQTDQQQRLIFGTDVVRLRRKEESSDGDVECQEWVVECQEWVKWEEEEEILWVA